MPKRGEYADIDHLPEALRALTQAIRDCCGILAESGITLRKIETTLHTSRNNISALLNGKRQRPSRALLERLQSLAQKHAPSSALPLPSVEELVRLHDRVITDLEHPSACKSCGGPLRLGDRAIPEPADHPVPPTRRDTVLPVPPELADRQVDWNGMAELHARLAADQIDDAAGILRHLAQTGEPAEVASAIAALHQQGIPDAAAIILAYAAQRTDEEIMYIVRELISSGNGDVVGELVSLRLERR